MKQGSLNRLVKLSALAACGVALCSHAEASPISLGIGSFGSPLITFSEVAIGTPLNGLTINGFSFFETIPNTTVTSGGPLNTNSITQPAALGFGNPLGETITVTMPSLMSGFGFGYATLAPGVVVPNAVTVTLFNGITNLGSLSYTASPDPMFPGGFMGIGDNTTPFDRVTFSFTAAALAYDFDNIRANPATPAVVPEPTSVVLLGSGVIGLVARRRHKSRA